MKYVMLTIPHSTFAECVGKQVGQNFASTVSIHIGMLLLCPTIPAIFPPPRKTAAYSASWKP